MSSPADIARATAWQKAHRARHNAFVQARSLRHRSLINKIKLASGCVDCGYHERPEALDFDHRDPSTKLFGIGERYTRSLSSLLEEIAKCDVVCANCHRIRTVDRRGGMTREVVLGAV